MRKRWLCQHLCLRYRVQPQRLSRLQLNPRSIDFVYVLPTGSIQIRWCRCICGLELLIFFFIFSSFFMIKLLYIRHDSQTWGLVKFLPARFPWCIGAQCRVAQAQDRLVTKSVPIDLSWDKINTLKEWQMLQVVGGLVVESQRLSRELAWENTNQSSNQVNDIFNCGKSKQDYYQLCNKVIELNVYNLNGNGAKVQKARMKAQLYTVHCTLICHNCRCRSCTVQLLTERASLSEPKCV